jgi:hypothetical protein
MTHQLTLEIPDDVYRPLLQKAKDRGQPIETVAQECLAEAIHKQAEAIPSRRWIGAFESNVPDAAERHHEYLGQALHDELQGRSGD